MTSGFDLLPAIDLRGGRVVRLQQGDFDLETAFSDDPVAVALAFVDAGARWLHVVDLDGARTGSPQHATIISEIVRAVGRRAAVEVAGGLRDRSAVAAVRASGAARVVLGTAALDDHLFVRGLIDAHGPERIAIALDVRDGLAVGQGWVRGAGGVPVDAALLALADAGVTTFEVTAIDRDGLLAGPDLELLGRLIALGRGEVIASGGVASIADLRAVRSIGARGAIVGRALYDGRLDLAAALSTAGDLGPSA